MLPLSVECFYSDDGKNFTPAAKKDLQLPNDMMPDEIRNVTLKLDGISTRYLRLTAKNQKRLPDWHGSHGGKCWVFCDEIILETK
jgi:hexosaminidase